MMAVAGRQSARKRTCRRSVARSPVPAGTASTTQCALRLWLLRREEARGSRMRRPATTGCMVCRRSSGSQPGSSLGQRLAQLVQSRANSRLDRPERLIQSRRHFRIRQFGKNAASIACRSWGVRTLSAFRSASLCWQEGAGLGTLGLHEHKLRDLATVIGFRDIRCVPIEDPFNNLYELRR